MTSPRPWRRPPWSTPWLTPSWRNVEWSDGMTRNQIKNLETYLGELKCQTDDLERRVEGAGRQGRRRHPVVRPASKQQDKAQGRRGGGGQPASITIDGVQAGPRRPASRSRSTWRRPRPGWPAPSPRPPPGDRRGLAPAAEEALIEQELEPPVQAGPRGRRAGRQDEDGQAKIEDARRIPARPDDPAERAADRSRTSSRPDTTNSGRTSRALLPRGNRAGSGRGRGRDPDQEIREAEAQVEALRSRQAALKHQFENARGRQPAQATDAVEIIAPDPTSARASGRCRTRSSAGSSSSSSRPRARRGSARSTRTGPCRPGRSPTSG